jgi:hypothetical protein
MPANGGFGKPSGGAKTGAPAKAATKNQPKKSNGG